MRVLRESSEAEVVAAFLRAELDSPRYRDTLRRLLAEAGEPESVLRNPALGNARENEFRATLLERHRGWLSREGFFGGFPQQVDWSLVALRPEEVLGILYINWDWWLRLSGGSRRPMDAAVRIRRDESPGSIAERHVPIAARLASPDPPPELIVAATPGDSRLVLMEGHARLTAYALFPEYLPAELEVFLGTSDEMPGWCQF